MAVQGILLDIEGTTTPISFVYDVLFPYARAHVHEYRLTIEESEGFEREHRGDVEQGLNPPAWDPRQPVDYIRWLMDRDRKSSPLKSLQGRIWQGGYDAGALKGVVFPDVPPALALWSGRGLDVRIYSSGSILAQRLIFSTTPDGNLTAFLRGYFDTGTGPKTSPASYAAIAAAFGLPPDRVLFISDVTTELDAAAAAGMRTRLCVRPGNHPQPPSTHSVISNFASAPIS